MQALKDAKRRVTQNLHETLGKAERVTKDEEQMKEALDGFKAFEADVKGLLENLKATQTATAKWTERNLMLAESMSTFFSSDSGSLKQASFQMSAAALRAHELVQRSAVRVVEDRGVAALQNILDNRIPGLRKKIAEHGNLETDVSSYTRRYKTMLEKKSQTDPEAVKVKEKLDRATAVYDQVHSSLLGELQSLLRERHELVRPVFVATLAAYSELQSVLSEEFTESIKTINGPDVDQVKREIGLLIETGGPPQETPSRNTLSIKGLFKAPSSKSSGPPPVPQSSMNSSFIAESTPKNDNSFQSNSGNSFSTSKGSPVNAAQKSPPPPIPTISFDTGGRPAPPPPSSTSAPSTLPVAQYAENGDNHDSGGGNVDAADFRPGCVCEAIFDYDGPDPGDLSFRKGERVTMEIEVSSGWWNGTRELDDSYGLFPDTYVKRIE